MKFPVRDINGNQTLFFGMKHDKNGKPDIYFTGPRMALINKREAYALALALVEMADTLPGDE